MNRHPHSLLRPTDQHKTILDETAILLQPHIDPIFREWSVAFRRVDPTVKPAQLQMLERVYRTYFKALREEIDRNDFFEEVTKTVHKLSRAGITFGQLMLSFHLFEDACLPYLKKIFPDKDRLIEALTAMDYSCHSCISALAVSYFDPNTSKIAPPIEFKLTQKKLSEYYKVTPREFEVMKRIVDGYKNREIAEVLKISVKTVEHHRASIMKKLGVCNAVELTKLAIRNRLA
jgi:DNA-binding CsgD family transcriptional regulator